MRGAVVEGGRCVVAAILIACITLPDTPADAARLLDHLDRRNVVVGVGKRRDRLGEEQ